jgi:tetratricopeptide (TPR) repeat protein
VKNYRFTGTWFPILTALCVFSFQSAFCAETSTQNTSTADAAWSQPISPSSRGDLHMARQQYRQAIEDYRMAGDSAANFNRIGIAYHHLFEFDQAKSNYERALALQPNFSDALNNLGAVYYAQQNYKKAVKCYRKSLKQSPRSAIVYSNLGTAYFADRKYKQGLEAYQAAFAIDPNFATRDPFAVAELATPEERAMQDYTMAELFAEAGMNDRAIVYLRKAIDEGFSDRKRLREDQELSSLRKTPEFASLMAQEKLL